MRDHKKSGHFIRFKYETPAQKEGSYEKRKIFRTYIIYNHQIGLSSFFCLSGHEKRAACKRTKPPQQKEG